MTKRLVVFPSIGQFRNIVRKVTDHARYKCDDADGNPVYYTNPTEYEIPTIEFTGKVKLHGTCSGISYSEDAGYNAQSKNRVLSVESDNYNFAQFVLHQIGTDVLDMMFEPLKKIVDTSNNTIAIFGEYCAGSIQKGVAISGLDKMFVSFAVKVRPHDESLDSYWLNYNDPDLGLERNFHPNIHSVNKFGTLSIDIDFNEPADYQNELVELTNAIEAECPVGKYFGRIKDKDNTTGEGIVWSHFFDGHLLMFKVKGEKHSTTRVRKLAQVCPEKLKSIKEFIEYAVTDNRLTQGIDELFTSKGIEVDMKHTGEFVKWVKNDIVKEEMDTLTESGLNMGDVARSINRETVNWWREHLKEF